MKLTIIIMTTFLLQVSAAGFAQKITLNEKNASLEKIVTEIRKQSGYDFIVNAKSLKSAKPVNIQVKDVSLEQALIICFANQPLTYSLEEMTVVIKDKPKTLLDRVSEYINATDISGRVMNEKGQPLPGVNVSEKGSGNHTATGSNGEFTLKNVKENAILVYSYIGYKTKEERTNGKSFITISLVPEVADLEEMVVMAYGVAKAKDVTGAVSRLGEKEVKNAPMGSTIQSLLQGKASGVNVVIQSASPTAPISVVVRGASSLSGNNQPLWVIDGVPDYSSTTVQTDGKISNSLSGNIMNSLYNLNLNDVESIDILKDASATALYGSRAANGVVLVTTKKGINGQKPTIELSSRIGYMRQDFNGYKYMEAPEYIRFADAAAREEAYRWGSFDYFTSLYLDEQAFLNLNTSEIDRSVFKTLPGAYYEGNTNWLKEMTQNPISQQYDLSLRGGTENIAYYVSFNNNNNQGIIKTGNSNLYGGRVNLEAKIRKSLKFGLNLNGSSRKTNDKDYMMTVLKQIRPDIPPYNPDGTLFTQDVYTENPYTTLLNTKHGEGQMFNGTGYLDYTIMDGLMLRSSYTSSYSNAQNLEYKRKGSTNNTTGSRSWTNPKIQTNVWENTLTYAKNFGKHDITALAGYSMEKNSTLLYAMKATNFPDDDILNDFSSAATVGALNEVFSENALISQFARAHYKYNNRYIISGTIRRDGSSRFGPDKRWGIFPSGAVAWLISEEDFVKKTALNKIVSYLKLRASIGKAGSQNLGNYDWITRIGSSRYNEIPAIAPSSIGNYGLQWEQTLMKDFGVDYGLWNDRIRGTFGYYQKNTDHLIYSLPLPPSSSLTSITSNVASLKNHGFEFDLKVDVIKKNNLTLTADFNMANNINRIVKINGITKELNFPGNNEIYMNVKEGDRTGQWYGFKTANRLFVTPEEIIALQGTTADGSKRFYRSTTENVGDLYFIDQNGDGEINDDDKVNLGYADPKLYGGFGLSLFYKNFMVNTTFTYAYGNKRLWKQPMDDVGYVGNYNHSNLIAGQSATLLSPYEASMPRMTPYGDGENGTFSDFFLHDASYIRLNALNISYRLPEKVFGNKLIQGISLTFQTTNLFTITKYPGFDPQGNWSDSAIGSGMGIDNSYYPSAKIYNLGVKFTFK
ncbi:SusC/RagA family TonB-linked outer membrane protein [Pedobacter nyackensis]|uniref:SusC/RagA family TonB-linked outer membrane protein n=1 Tax=Pedobacter nyackensis TaxID=475255 RepID=UPI0029314D74|nr:SusC/RagA family TonB-linked outer membrane protein [Pedobacter nyackensis]